MKLADTIKNVTAYANDVNVSVKIMLFLKINLSSACNLVSTRKLKACARY